MADSALNQLAAADRQAAGAGRQGDVPDRLRRRYFTDRRRGPGVGFYVDARTEAPAFRDRGRRLTTDHNDPQIVRDLVAIARHRGWTGIDVRGQTDFRREVWITARAAGLEVRGYAPTARDLQDLARRVERRARQERDGRGPAVGAPAPETPASRERLAIVETVVRRRIVEPAVQARVIAAARARIAGWLERGADFPSGQRPGRTRESALER